MNYIKLLILLFFVGCSNPNNLLESGKKYEQIGLYNKAEQKYLTVVVNFPKSPQVPEAKYRLGLLYKDVMKDYVQASMWFSDILKNHKETEFYKLADVCLLESPDYVGALDGNLVVLGDKESGGKNMKITYEFKKIDFDLYSVIFRLFAGEKLIRQERKFYLKTNGEIREYNINPKTQKKDLKYTLIFKLPVEKGRRWTTKKEDKETVYTIVDTGLTVRLKNKIFENCIKISENYKGETGIRYLYYAPNKGCIKIATSSLRNPQEEFTVLELIE